MGWAGEASPVAKCLAGRILARLINGANICSPLDISTAKIYKTQKDTPSNE